MTKFPTFFVPESVDRYDTASARRAAIECLNAADQVLQFAKQPVGGTSKRGILNTLYDLERACVTSRMYRPNAAELFPGDGVCRRAYELAGTIRAVIAEVVAAFEAKPNAPTDGWASLWEHYEAGFGKVKVLWDSYKCGEVANDTYTDSVVEWIQGHIQQAALNSRWHFGAWPEIGERLNQFSQNEMSDLMGVLLRMSEHLTPRPTQHADPRNLPPMWEGVVPDFSINTLADMHKWLIPTSEILPVMRDHALAFTQVAPLDFTREVLRDAWRLLDQLGQEGFPERLDSEISSIHDAEAVMVKLVRWIRSHMPSKDDTASLNAAREADAQQRAARAREDHVCTVRDALKGRTLRLFNFLLDKKYFTDFITLRESGTVFTKENITDEGIKSGIVHLIRELESIEAPFIVEWSLPERRVKLLDKPKDSEVQE